MLEHTDVEVPSLIVSSRLRLSPDILGYSIIQLYTPTDDNEWCPGGYREYVPGGGHLNACLGVLEGIIEACPGGSGTT